MFETSGSNRTSNRVEPRTVRYRFGTLHSAYSQPLHAITVAIPIFESLPSVERTVDEIQKFTNRDFKMTVHFSICTVERYKNAH